MSFDMMGITHASLSLWKDQKAYEKFRSVEKKAERKISGVVDPKNVDLGGEDDIFRVPPMMSYYEGVLVLEPNNIKKQEPNKKKKCERRSRRSRLGWRAKTT